MREGRPSKLKDQTSIVYNTESSKHIIMKSGVRHHATHAYFSLNSDLICFNTQISTLYPHWLPLIEMMSAVVQHVSPPVVTEKCHYFSQQCRKDPFNSLFFCVCVCDFFDLSRIEMWRRKKYLITILDWVSSPPNSDTTDNNKEKA